MKTTNNTKIRLTLFNLALLVTGAFAQTTSPLGPRPDALPHRDYLGTLVVYSATEARPDGKDTYYYPHTSYEVFRDGQPFKHIDNGRTLAVETPDRVALPKGDYTVVAQSETAGTVKLPVTIQTGRTTVIHLEEGQDWRPDVATADRAKLVRLPNGQPIGYQAR